MNREFRKLRPARQVLFAIRRIRQDYVDTSVFDFSYQICKGSMVNFHSF